MDTATLSMLGGIVILGTLAVLTILVILVVISIRRKITRSNKYLSDKISKPDRPQSPW